MCIAVFLWRSHPLYPLLLLHNRDEYYSRPTEALAWWGSPRGRILGGRDVSAGGTWLACSRSGRMAFLTNVREVEMIPRARTRGDLPIQFLQSKKSPLEFALEAVEEAHQYNGYNLIVADFPSESMVYMTNRPKGDSNYVSEVSPGIHVLSNACLDSPWPKRLRDGFEELLDVYGDGEFPVKEMADRLMKNTIKDKDRSLLPGVYPPQLEYELSSVFVDTDFPLDPAGTRSTSALSVKSDREVSFYERHLEDEEWKENTVTFSIEEEDREVIFL
ncbi:transport and Golgi organization protein 2 homolog isoform X2 [Punica granatum]|uniref:Transport and Golgi organization protein 2 homolog isoform X2 n=1 Tax=Punica granatum TaxID=22663 RepID=A0A6P8CNV2_PUNGR|nr:transport and Golgi organization protein 2 homolog isoform X2 [Punica granatum]